MAGAPAFVRANVVVLDAGNVLAAMSGPEAWLAAPFFMLFGPSVAALKFPLLCLNVAVATLLLWILVKKRVTVPFASFDISPDPGACIRIQARRF